jgi:uncharacterized protein
MGTNSIDKATKLWQLDQDKEAIELLENLNLDKNAKANTLIGKILIRAERGISNIKKDTIKGIKFLKFGLELGDSEAGLELANIFYFGKGVKVSKKKAEEFWKLSFELGDELAGFELANFYFDDLHEKISEAIIIYNKLIERKEFEENCYYKLYRIFEKGIGGIKPNQELALKYLEKGANKLNVNCCMTLGLRYYRGDGIKQDVKKALEFVKKVKEDEFFKKEVNIILAKMLNNEKI